MHKFGMPSWSSKQWDDFENSLEGIFSNVAITSDDFYNVSHKDPDHNKMTYGIFAYIHNTSGIATLPPANVPGHAFQFPQWDCNVDFGTTPGIIEVMWPSYKFEHHTTPSPPQLCSNEDKTHFGCSFQVSQSLVYRTKAMNNMGPGASTSSRTVSSNDRIANWELKNNQKI
jgi:hypothetical protein